MLIAFRDMKKIKYNRIKAAIAESDMDNGDIAKALKVSEQTVSRWCTNESQPPIPKLHKLAQLLDVDIRNLLISTKNDKGSSE